MAGSSRAFAIKNERAAKVNKPIMRGGEIKSIFLKIFVIMLSRSKKSVSEGALIKIVAFSKRRKDKGIQAT